MAIVQRRCDHCIDAQIEDLGLGDFLHVKCAGHDLLIPPVGLLQG